LAALSRGLFIFVETNFLAEDIQSRVKGNMIVGVGNSGSKLAQLVVPGSPKIEVRTLEYSRQRDQRVLEVGDVPEAAGPMTLIDDIVVSGLTLARVAAEIGEEVDASVGLLYKSKSATKLAGVPITYSFRYSRDGGGTPPINSAESLLENPDRLNALSERYFLGNEREFGKLLEGLLA